MRDRINFFRLDRHNNCHDLTFANLHALDDQEANEGRATVVDFHSDTGVEEVKKFLKEAQHTREKIVSIEELVNQIREYHGKITGAAARNEEVHKKLNQAMDEIRRLFDTVKEALKKMEQESNALSDKKDAELKRPADIRIMSSQYTSLQCWFFETWTEYNECQSDYREKCKEKLTRQIQITEKKVTQEEINTMIESGNFTVFSINAQFQPKDIEEMESRHNDITKLAKSLKQLHEMFKDLALMVEQQGEMLNNIEKNVDQARDYVADAERECHQAVDLTNKWRKKKLICAVVILIIVVIVGAVIAVVAHLQTK
ncbi:hypothetical protein ACHWQZ_G005573 [Mnemiopsis leidyi]